MSETNAIECRDVYYSANGHSIIKGLTGSFAKGKITAIVGPSGAGKTTLFRLCNGMRSIDSGQILIDQKPIDAFEPTALRKKVGVVLQQATMLSGTVHENVALPLTLTGKALPQANAEQSLKEVGLEKELLTRKSKDLSGGQKQKLSIARTLLNQPEVLLLDEITSSLDRVSQHDIEQLIQMINRTYGTTIIWITHNLEQARQIGQDVWVMMDGQLIEAGPSELLDQPKDERVLQFVKGEMS
ncbi:putative ABC transport system ATP-binding protein [Alkalihalobacillus xiaoxiensis]|uniref:ABC transport system ATP-binding protein n=1 Tax=Shouchella xiaoxiensis TaxID=766895 RepID=A0ABS2SY38_9BACI|nr:phosphate ABC transporter ATP-binding protein [Shouchella xiaoxiensis]MBM7839157.1 putative ABC transport system ATP-binding protein [Shouchella xiaoxiensis]